MSADRRVALVVLLAGLLICGVTLVRPHDLSGMPMPAFWAHKLLQGDRYDLVLLGDSRVYRGLSPTEMSRALSATDAPMRAFNYGFSSVGLTPGYLAAGGGLLDPGSPAPAILIGVTPLSLTPGAAADNGYLDRAARSRKELWLDRWLGVVPHVLAPLPLRDWSALLPGGKAERVRYLQVYHKDGWVASNKVPARPDEAVAAYRANAASVSSDIEEALLAQVTLWAADGIDVLAFRPPTTEAMRAVEAEVTGFDEASFVTRFEAAGGHWIEVDPTAYDSYDGSHLWSESALQLSRDLATAIAMSRD